MKLNKPLKEALIEDVIRACKLKGVEVHESKLKDKSEDELSELLNPMNINNFCMNCLISQINVLEGQLGRKLRNRTELKAHGIEVLVVQRDKLLEEKGE